jgi:hypothetical protein
MAVCWRKTVQHEVLDMQLDRVTRGLSLCGLWRHRQEPFSTSFALDVITIRRFQNP